MEVIIAIMIDALIFASAAIGIRLIIKIIAALEKRELIHDIRKIRMNHIITAAAAIVILTVMELTGILPYMAVRTASSIYLTINYPTKGFQFESAEYARVFGDCSVKYQNKSGEALNLMLSPKQFPIIVSYDSEKGNG